MIFLVTLHFRISGKVSNYLPAKGGTNLLLRGMRFTFGINDLLSDIAFKKKNTSD